MAELRADDAESDEREKRCLSIIHRLQNLRNEWHLPSVRSLFGGPVDGSRSTEWRQDVEHALREASKRAGINPYKEIAILALLSHSGHMSLSGSVLFLSASDAFLSEMDVLNRHGTPDDYRDEWGFDAHYRRVEAKRLLDRSVIRTVQAVEITA